MDKHNYNDGKKGRGRPKKIITQTSVASETPVQVKEPVKVEAPIKTEVKVEVVVNPLKRDAPFENYFILCTGKSLKNIKELADVMETLEDAAFKYHVTSSKNDFAAWVENIFKDVDLAKKIKEGKDQKNLQLIIYRYIATKLW